MTPLEEKLTKQIVQKASSQKALAVATVVFIVTFGLLYIPHAPMALVGVSLAASVLAFVLLIRRSRGARFLPDGIEVLERGGTSTLIPYTEIDAVRRAGDEVIIETSNRTVRLGRDGSREPYTADVVDELAAYLESNVAEARALAAAREAVVAFLARGGVAGDDYRSAPAPRSALEAIARSRVMPARLRVEAVQALGDDAPEELSVESSNASENERRRV